MTMTTMFVLSLWAVLMPLSFPKISALEHPFKGPGLPNNNPVLVIFHPPTGLCAMQTTSDEQIKLGSCTKSSCWQYYQTKILNLLGMYVCLTVDDLGKNVKIRVDCRGSHSKWDVGSDSKTHLSSKSKSGNTVCLDVDSDNTLVTNTCKCLNSDSNCDPGSQWFKLVEATTTPQP